MRRTTQRYLSNKTCDKKLVAIYIISSGPVACIILYASRYNIRVCAPDPGAVIYYETPRASGKMAVRPKNTTPGFRFTTPDITTHKIPARHRTLMPEGVLQEIHQNFTTHVPNSHPLIPHGKTHEPPRQAHIKLIRPSTAVVFVILRKLHHKLFIA